MRQAPFFGQRQINEVTVARGYHRPRQTRGSLHLVPGPAPIGYHLLRDDHACSHPLSTRLSTEKYSTG